MNSLTYGQLDGHMSCTTIDIILKKKRKAKKKYQLHMYIKFCRYLYTCVFILTKFNAICLVTSDYSDGGFLWTLVNDTPVLLDHIIIQQRPSFIYV